MSVLVVRGGRGGRAYRACAAHADYLSRDMNLMHPAGNV